ncbi:MAG: N-6 DNA methylase [Thermodesulfobacteriota bacterium]|nr:N-6 DNA methylase [Thermodesulfobacteriota bacterium]
MITNLIESTIDQLDLKQGQLHEVSETAINYNKEDWLNLGDWFAAAEKAQAEKIFFVDNNPVVIFAKCGQEDIDKIEAFNRLWCLSRPRILFLETDGELSVIDLAQAPIHYDGSKKIPQLKTLAILTSINDVSKNLQDFHRDHIESGKVFENGRFGDIKNRADKALIADLKTVRRELLRQNLSSSYAHALIGRSIFIRYLEDRQILTKEYFASVAGKSHKWQNILDKPSSKDNFDFSDVNAIYPRILQDKSFTYALFHRLSNDFNGDMFPNIDDEEQVVKDRHLNLIQDLLYGDAGKQKKLFFFSYRFDIIPLDLISAIYEEFYHSSSDQGEKISKARQYGAYYTPPVLAEFVCSRLLSSEVLQKNPKILDPACGSGIFLVQAFRRIIRHRIAMSPTPLSFDELRKILGQQMLGIEVNEEAARITAFSLYLAMLHYLDPPSIIEHIRKGSKLPRLIASEKKAANHYDSIHVGNTFTVEINTVGTVDVIIGNPPWGHPGKKADKDAANLSRTMLQWCLKNKLPIGDEEPSQAFLWRVLDFLKPNGRCALLTSAGVLFKHSSTSQSFRKEWMNNVCINEVFNFSHVRKLFFKGSSPFIMIHFQKTGQNKSPVEYWSLKNIIVIKETQAVLLSQYDRSFLIEKDLTDNKTWKINWFGRHADDVFLCQLFYLGKLVEIVDREKSGQGYKKSPPEYEYPEISQLMSLNIKQLDKFSDLKFEQSPKKFHRAGIQDVYYGQRLLVKRGISQDGKVKGLVVSRFETEDFCFTNAINGLKLINPSEKTYLLILGILWSSFSRYFFFNISSNWGLWHYEIHLEDELLQLPIPQNSCRSKKNRVVSIVKKLRNYRPAVKNITKPNGVFQEEIERNRRKWEAELDEAVFDLYNFTDEQRDLIRDCCEVTLPFFYQPYNSQSTMPAVKDDEDLWIINYAERFAKRWQPYLNEDEVMRADLHIGASGNIVAMEFYPADNGDEWALTPRNDSWGYILEEIGKAMPRSMGTSQILLDGIVHIVTDNSIIVIKRNEKRFWTRSLAREDADSTLAKRMMETLPEKGGFA